MGVDYVFACDEAKQKIDPGDIDNLGTKRGSISHPHHPVGSIVVWASLHLPEWIDNPIRLVGDTCEDISDGYEDVTEKVILSYNQVYRTSYQWTGGDDGGPPRDIHYLMDLPRYKSHKVVQAVKLAEPPQPLPDGDAVIFPEDRAISSFTALPGWMNQYKGNAEGDLGYFVRYEDGYQSWSPSKAFEEGYTRID